ncbi:hypothetical protein POM88_040443 [Heracleum sosnowskyi]|uniref:Uncharacterized protein n=1 Tax=Heracleum sosnowskyi TaxID=360622 RepID=A0AAD8HC64_9APIA|nr:hypothetical protein POM88_040443 [Heracleum sosnowskyi]
MKTVPRLPSHGQHYKNEHNTGLTWLERLNLWIAANVNCLGHHLVLLLSGPSSTFRKAGIAPLVEYNEKKIFEVKLKEMKSALTTQIAEEANLCEGNGALRKMAGG